MCIPPWQHWKMNQGQAQARQDAEAGTARSSQRVDATEGAAALLPTMLEGGVERVCVRRSPKWQAALLLGPRLQFRQLLRAQPRQPCASQSRQATGFPRVARTRSFGVQPLPI